MPLLEEGFPQILIKVLEKCLGAIDSDEKQIPDSKSSAKDGFTLISWCLPVFKCLPLLLGAQISLLYSGRCDS